jgi:DNA-binding transcriptional ArsR family regulator
MSFPAVSKHLKVLERAGLVARGRDAQFRPRRLQPEPLREIDAWLESYRVLWDARFDRLETYLQALQKGNSDGGHN